MVSTIVSSIIIFLIIVGLLWLFYWLAAREQTARNTTPLERTQEPSKLPPSISTVLYDSPVMTKLCLIVIFLVFVGIGVASLVSSDPRSENLAAYRAGGRSAASQIVTVDADKAAGHPGESPSLNITHIEQRVIMADGIAATSGQTQIQIDGERKKGYQTPACLETEIGLFQDSAKENIEVTDRVTASILPYGISDLGWTYSRHIVRGARMSSKQGSEDFVGILRICLGEGSFAQDHFSVLVKYSKDAPKVLKPIRIVYVDPRDFANQTSIGSVVVTVEEKYPISAWWTVCLPDGCIRESTERAVVQVSPDHKSISVKVGSGLASPGITIYYESRPEDILGTEAVIGKIDM